MNANDVSAAFMVKKFKFIDEAELQKSPFSEVFEDDHSSDSTLFSKENWSIRSNMGDEETEGEYEEEVYEPPAWVAEIIDEFVDIAVLFQEKGSTCKITTLGEHSIDFALMRF